MKPTASQLQTLRAVARYCRYRPVAAPGELQDGAMASDVAVRLNISIDAAEKRLDRLAVAGLVADHQIRWPHARSGWITLAVLTEKGRAALGIDDEREQ